jgi:hypothetical protein
MKYVCIDLDGTFTNEALQDKIIEVLKANEGRDDVKIGIVTARCIFDDFHTGAQLSQPYIDDFLVKLKGKGITLDFVATTHCLYLNYIDNKNYTLKPMFEDFKSDYIAYRDNNRLLIDKLKINVELGEQVRAIVDSPSSEHTDTKLDEALRKLDGLSSDEKDEIKAIIKLRDAESVIFKKYVQPELDDPASRSAKILQIDAVIKAFSDGEDSVEVLLIDDAKKHADAVNKNSKRPIQEDKPRPTWSGIGVFYDKSSSNIAAVGDALNNFIRKIVKKLSKTHAIEPSISKHKEKKSLQPKARGDLKKSIKEFEDVTGQFSTYQCEGGVNGENISFARKPAQQFLASAMFADSKSQNPSVIDKNPLTSRGDIPPGEKDASVKGFTPDSKKTLTVTKRRIKRLQASAKVYINPDIISTELYKQACGKLGIQDSSVSPNGEAWQHLATNICHAQRIDLLVGHKTIGGKAVTTEKEGKIDDTANAILLLSTPALNFAYSGTKPLMDEEGKPNEQAKHFITNMYRLLFSAALANGCTHITMAAAGLGVFGGGDELPNFYFNCLFAAAKEYPQLGIIYNPAKYGSTFKQTLQQFEEKGITNVAFTDRDVMFLADEMAKKDINCAMHNPSDADVVYGIYDVGEYWKDGKGSSYVGEEHIGAMTTAALNSRGLNPSVYENPVELKPSAYAELKTSSQKAKAPQISK